MLVILVRSLPWHVIKQGIASAIFVVQCGDIQMKLLHDFNNATRPSGFHIHEDIMTWKGFPHYWPYVRESTGHRWIPLTKGQ